MKRSLITIALFFSQFALAETTTLTVEGMHCGGCKKMVTKAVCNDKKISEALSDCTVSVNEKTQIGTVILKTKEAKTLDLQLVETAITSAGEDYKIIKKETVK
jgi:copper chaperone CopZ